MADYISGVSSTTEINLAPAVENDFYTLEMANLANDIVEDCLEDGMDWTMFGVGGPA
jgi:hypothetical protein